MGYSLTVRRSFLVFIFCTIPVFVCHGVTLQVSCHYDGFWGNWSNYFTECQGGYGGFALYNYGEHPSTYSFAFLVDGYRSPTKKEIKQHNKSQTWWEYTGTVEYYISDVYPTLKDCLKKMGRPLEARDTEGYEYKKIEEVARLANIKNGRQSIGLKRVQAKAIIKIQPYKKHPKTYNIWVDGVGFAIDLNGCQF